MWPFKEPTTTDSNNKALRLEVLRKALLRAQYFSVVCGFRDDSPLIILHYSSIFFSISGVFKGIMVRVYSQQFTLASPYNLRMRRDV